MLLSNYCTGTMYFRSDSKGCAKIHEYTYMRCLFHSTTHPWVVFIKGGVHWRVAFIAINVVYIDIRSSFLIIY